MSEAKFRSMMMSNELSPAILIVLMSVAMGFYLLLYRMNVYTNPAS